MDNPYAVFTAIQKISRQHEDALQETMLYLLKHEYNDDNHCIANGILKCKNLIKSSYRDKQVPTDVDKLDTAINSIYNNNHQQWHLQEITAYAGEVSSIDEEFFHLNKLTKTCKSCNENKNIAEFTSSGKYKKGGSVCYRSVCKDCDRTKCKSYRDRLK